MADKFIDGASGDDLNSGEMGAPWRSFGGAACAAFIAAGGVGNRLLAAGTFRPALATLNTYVFPTLSALNLFSLEQWQGRSQAVLRADAPLVAVSWSNVAGDVWEATLPTGLGAPSGMTCEYDSSTWSGASGYQMNYGVMKPAADDAGVASTAWSFLYVTGTGRCRIHVPGHDPNVSQITMVRAGAGNIVTMQNCTECVVLGLDIRLTSIGLGGVSYCFGADNCTGCILRDCTLADGGAHCVGWYGASNTDNTTRGCNGSGMYVNATVFANYSSDANLSGCLYDSCTAHVVGSRNGANEDLFTSITTMGGFYVHTDGAGGTVVQDMEFRGCGAHVYMPTAGAATGGNKCYGYGATDVAAYTGAWNDRTGRHVRYIDCWSRNDTSMTIAAAPYHLRGSYHFTQTGPSDVGGISGAMVTLRGGVSVDLCKPLFESCEIITNLDRATGFVAPGFRALFDTFAAGEGLGLIGCSVVNVGSDGNATDHLFQYQSKANVAFFVYGCLLGHANKTARLCQGDSGLGAAVHEFRQNLYLNIADAANGHSENAALDTWAEWNAAVDTTNALRVASTPAMAFVGLATSLQVGPASSARASISPSVSASHGYNGQPFAGDYGCYQYGSLAVSKAGAAVGIGMGL